jgi:hypothetical protein
MDCNRELHSVRFLSHSNDDLLNAAHSGHRPRYVGQAPLATTSFCPVSPVRVHTVWPRVQIVFLSFQTQTETTADGGTRPRDTLFVTVFPADEVRSTGGNVTLWGSWVVYQHVRHGFLWH